LGQKDDVFDDDAESNTSLVSDSENKNEDDDEDHNLEQFYKDLREEIKHEEVPIMTRSNYAVHPPQDNKYTERRCDITAFIGKGIAFKEKNHAETIERLFSTIKDPTPSSSYLSVISLDATFLSTNEDSPKFSTLLSAHAINGDCQSIPVAYMLTTGKETIENWFIFIKSVLLMKSSQFDLSSMSFISDNHPSIRGALQLVFGRSVCHYQCIKHLLSNIDNIFRKKAVNKQVKALFCEASQTLVPQIRDEKIQILSNIFIKERERRGKSTTRKDNSTEGLLTREPQTWARSLRSINSEILTSNASERDNNVLRRARCCNVTQLIFRATDNMYGAIFKNLHKNKISDQKLLKVPTTMFSQEIAFSLKMNVSGSTTASNIFQLPLESLGSIGGSFEVKTNEGVKFKDLKALSLLYLKTIRRKTSWIMMRRALYDCYITESATVTFDGLAKCRDTSKKAQKPYLVGFIKAHCSLCENTSDLHHCCHIIATLLELNELKLSYHSQKAGNYSWLLCKRYGSSTIQRAFKLSRSSIRNKNICPDAFTFPSLESNLETSLILENSLQTKEFQVCFAIARKNQKNQEGVTKRKLGYSEWISDIYKKPKY
jgi:hypothetical protein